MANLYKSEFPNSIWTVCLYSPLEYLLMWISRQDEVRSWAKHLPVFDGVLHSGQGLKILTNQTTKTRFMRVVYMEEERLKRYLDPLEKAPDVETDHDARELSRVTCFSFLWFLFYNRLIDLFWAWSGDSGCLQGNGDLSEDFMIFNGQQFLRYDKKYKSMILCWNPSPELFSKAHDIFGDAVGVFSAISTGNASIANMTVEEKKEPLGQTWKLNQIENAHRRELFSLLRNQGTIFSNAPDLRTKVVTLFKEVVETVCVKTQWPETTHPKEVNGRKLFISTLQSIAETLAGDDSKLEALESNFRLRLSDLGEDDLAALYDFMRSNYFIQGVKKIFPLTANVKFANELVPGVSHWPQENNH